MQTPAFFAAVPGIVMHDALAELLGAAKDGLVEYGYVDAVKLAGHSCPTVARAYLMTLTALARLYPQQTPRRGELRVELRQRHDEGVAGVIGSIAGLITGAANDAGFQGLAGRFGRNLLRFGVPMQGELRFTRIDSGHAVELAHHPHAVPRPPALAGLLQAAVQADADAATRQAFADAWQDWVRAILVDHAGDPALITVVH